MSAALLYKYRSLDNWRFLVDILVNSRLFAAPFDSLNDPMEGRYFTFGPDVTKEYQRAVLESRKRRRICSLSASHDNTLLWAYYGGGHRGVAVGVARPPKRSTDFDVKDVSYDSGVYVRGDPTRRDADAAALDILAQKQLAWEHEREVRVFSSEKYVPVGVRRLVLGCLIDPLDEQLLRTLVHKVQPGVSVVKLPIEAMNPKAPRSEA